MSADVILCVSGMVPGYLSIFASYVTNRDECLSAAASLVVLLTDGVRVSMQADIGAGDVIERARWEVTITPELRESCRKVLREEQAVVLGEIARAA